MAAHRVGVRLARSCGWALAAVIAGTSSGWAKCEFLLVPGGDVVLTMSERDSTCTTGPLPMWEGSGGVPPDTMTEEIEIIEQARQGWAFVYGGGSGFGYRPAEGFVGRDQFRIQGRGRGRDGGRASFVGIVTVSVAR